MAGDARAARTAPEVRRLRGRGDGRGPGSPQSRAVHRRRRTRAPERRHAGNRQQAAGCAPGRVHASRRQRPRERVPAGRGPPVAQPHGAVPGQRHRPVQRRTPERQQRARLPRRGGRGGRLRHVAAGRLALRVRVQHGRRRRNAPVLRGQLPARLLLRPRLRRGGGQLPGGRLRPRRSRQRRARRARPRQRPQQRHVRAEPRRSAVDHEHVPVGRTRVLGAGRGRRRRRGHRRRSGCRHRDPRVPSRRQQPPQHPVHGDRGRCDGGGRQRLLRLQHHRRYDTGRVLVAAVGHPAGRRQDLRGLVLPVVLRIRPLRAPQQRRDLRQYAVGSAGALSRRSHRRLRHGRGPPGPPALRGRAETVSAGADHARHARRDPRRGCRQAPERRSGRQSEPLPDLGSLLRPRHGVGRPGHR